MVDRFSRFLLLITRVLQCRNVDQSQCVEQISVSLVFFLVFFSRFGDSNASMSVTYLHGAHGDEGRGDDSLSDSWTRSGQKQLRVGKYMANMMRAFYTGLSHTGRQTNCVSFHEAGVKDSICCNAGFRFTFEHFIQVIDGRFRSTPLIPDYLAG